MKLCNYQQYYFLNFSFALKYSHKKIHICLFQLNNEQIL